MKKILLFSSALIASICSLNAQGWNTTGAHDDFATATVYKNGSNLEGIVWWADAEFVLGRTGDGKMTVTATNAGGSDNGLTTGNGRYPLIGLNFNDDQDNGSGNPFTVNLSAGANIQIDIENTSSTSQVYMAAVLEDINNVQAQIEPNISDVTTSWGDPQRKALNGFTLAPNTRKTIIIDLSSVPGAIGGLTRGAYNCSGPADCPVTTYSIDITQIKTVLFQVNFGKDNIDLSEGDGDYTTETFLDAATCAASAYTGVFYIHDFRIGSSVTSVKSESIINESIKIFPNPAKENLTVSFDAIEGADVTLTDIVGNSVYSTKATTGSNTIDVNTSNLTSGMYILNIITENGKVARKVTIK